VLNIFISIIQVQWMVIIFFSRPLYHFNNCPLFIW